MRTERLLPVAAVGALLVALLLGLFAPALLGGEVLSSGDRTWFQPPFVAERPADLVRPSNVSLSDPVETFHPDFWRTRQALADGGTGLWNASSGGGRPLLAAQQHAPLYPPHLLAFVLPFWDAWGWVAALKVLIAFSGLFLLCRRAFGLGRAASALGATAFAVSTYTVVWLQHPLTNAWVLLPWATLLAHRVARGGGGGTLLALAALVGVLLLAGHPESQLIVLLAVAAYLVAVLGSDVRDGRTTRRIAVGRAARAATALGGGLLLSAVVTLPVLEAFANAASDPRGSEPPPWSVLGSWTFPEWWGRPDKDLDTGGPFGAYAERTAYFGALPMLFAFAGFAWRPRRAQVFFAGMIGLALLVVMPTPVNALVRALPGGDLMALTRLLVLVVFAASVLAAFGLQRLLDAGPSSRRRALAVMAATAALPLAVLLFNAGLLDEAGAAVRQLPAVREGETSADVVRLGAVWRWAVLALGGVALIALLLRLGPRAATIVGVAVVGVTAVDLVTLNREYQPTVAEARADPAAPALLRQARAQAGDGRIMGADRTYYPNLSARYGTLDPRHHDHPTSARYEALFSALGGGRPDPWIFSLNAPGIDAFADLFAVRWVLLPSGELRANDGALPRAWMAHSWRVAADRDVALLATAGAPAATARDTPAIEGARPAPADATPPGPARLTVDRDERVDVDVDARRPGYLVLHDSYYPGWQATVDGEEAEILPANVNFRAVAVPAGAHTVSFVYRPASAIGGAAISVVTAVVLLVLAGLLAARRRRA